MLCAEGYGSLMFARENRGSLTSDRDVDSPIIESISSAERFGCIERGYVERIDSFVQS